MYLRCKTSQLQTHTLQGLESFLARHFACSSLPSQGHLQTKCMPGAPEPTGVRQGRHPRPGQGATSWALQACTQPCPGLCTLLCPACVITDVVAPGTEIKIRRRRGKKKIIMPGVAEGQVMLSSRSHLQATGLESSPSAAPGLLQLATVNLRGFMVSCMRCFRSQL